MPIASDAPGAGRPGIDVSEAAVEADAAGADRRGQRAQLRGRESRDGDVGSSAEDVL